ncbi:MAG: glycosyltransferase, partial [Acidocella sp.]|nr:glycosyltransferase [Acidocella sp.]
MRKSVSLVVPFYNEESAVARFCDALLSSLDPIIDIDWEIICIDDGSQDATLDRLIAHTSHDPRFKILEFSRNFGKEAALTAGIDIALGDAVIPIDADLQDPPALIARMIEAWRLGAEI